MVGDPDFLHYSFPNWNFTPRECLETFLVVATGEGGATGIWWVKASGVTQRPAVQGLPSQQVFLVQNVNHFATSVPLSHSVHPGNSQIRAVSQGSFYWVHNNEGGSAYTFCLLYQIFK